MNIVSAFPFVFYGRVFNAYLADDRSWYIAVNDICEALGVDAHAQRKRIQRDAAISDRLVNLPLETAYRDSSRVQAVTCLNLRALPYWLGTIDVGRVNEEHRAKIILYKREFAEAAWAVFRSDMVPQEVLAEMDTYETPEQQQYNAIMDQARKLRQQIDLLSGKLEQEIARVGGEMADIAGRLGVLETRLMGRTIISPAQAKLLNDLISMVALSKHEKTKAAKTQCFADVHAAFKNTFQLPIYSILPEDQLDSAVSYLAGQWSKYHPGEPVPEVFRSYQPALF